MRLKDFPVPEHTTSDSYSSLYDYAEKLEARLEAADRLADASENVSLECDNFHHSISHQHALFEDCLPMLQFEAALKAYRADGGDDAKNT